MCSEDHESNKTDKVDTSEEEESSTRSGKEAVSVGIVEAEGRDRVQLDFTFPPGGFGIPVLLS